MKWRQAAVALWLAAAVAGSTALAFSPPPTPSQSAHAIVSPLAPPSRGDPAKIALGRDLFQDPRLSRSGRRSCAACHDLRTNGASAAARDRGSSGRLMRFNTPTVFNSALSFRFGWEGKARTLQDFTLQTLRTQHPAVGQESVPERMRINPALAARLRKIYHEPPSDRHVADALSAFMATLVTTDAPFDRWLKGDRTALNQRQLRGFARFSELGCASCHQGASIGANLHQRRGIFHPLGRDGPMFLRVPSLRNVAVTPPYFHDGQVTSLPEAIRQMGRAQLDLTINDRDVGDIAAFLSALTGTYQGRPLRPARSGR